MSVIVSLVTRVRAPRVLAAALLLLACSSSHYTGGGRQNDLPVDQRSSSAGSGVEPSVDLTIGGEPGSAGMENAQTGGNEALGGSAGLGGTAAGTGGTAGTGGAFGGGGGTRG
jgi:hypothetical protein